MNNSKLTLVELRGFCLARLANALLTRVQNQLQSRGGLDVLPCLTSYFITFGRVKSFYIVLPCVILCLDMFHLRLYKLRGLYICMSVSHCHPKTNKLLWHLAPYIKQPQHNCHFIDSLEKYLNNNCGPSSLKNNLGCWWKLSEPVTCKSWSLWTLIASLLLTNEGH